MQENFHATVEKVSHKSGSILLTIFSHFTAKQDRIEQLWQFHKIMHETNQVTSCYQSENIIFYLFFAAV